MSAWRRGSGPAKTSESGVSRTPTSRPFGVAEAYASAKSDEICRLGREDGLEDLAGLVKPAPSQEERAWVRGGRGGSAQLARKSTAKARASLPLQSSSTLFLGSILSAWFRQSCAWDQ